MLGVVKGKTVRGDEIGVREGGGCQGRMSLDSVTPSEFLSYFFGWWSIRANIGMATGIDSQDGVNGFHTHLSNVFTCIQFCSLMSHVLRFSSSYIT
jgi:hypothetical protein